MFFLKIILSKLFDKYMYNLTVVNPIFEKAVYIYT
jgi:hypothetical protein